MNSVAIFFVCKVVCDVKMTHDIIRRTLRGEINLKLRTEAGFCIWIIKKMPIIC